MKHKNNLKNTLDSNGISQAELAADAKISLGTINKLYNCKISVTQKTQSKLIIGLNKVSTKKYTVDQIFPQN